MNAKSQMLKEALEKAGINTMDVRVIGSIAHIDSFKKYHNTLIHLMTAAGFAILRVSDGAHMDGSSGYRASFIAK